MNKHVDFLNKEDQEKWLQQRGWVKNGPTWRDPDTGLGLVFVAALSKAKAACRLPADYELRPC